MAMSMLVLNFAEICLDFGMSKAIIHRQDTSREQLSSLYWVNVFVGWVLFAASFAATPLVVIMFREPRLYHLVPLGSALFLIGPIGAQFALLLQKELRFRSLAVVEIVGSFVGALAAIGAAIAGLGVYALVLAARRPASRARDSASWRLLRRWSGPPPSCSGGARRAASRGRRASEAPCPGDRSSPSGARAIPHCSRGGSHGSRCRWFVASARARSRRVIAESAAVTCRASRTTVSKPASVSPA
jgi:Polysaccharide biosynthesis protein